MSADAQTASTGALAAGAAEDDPSADRADTAGRLLRRLSLLPSLILMAWLLAGLPLLLAGHFAPVPMLVVSLPLAVALVVFGLRWIPDRSPGVWLGDASRRPGTPWWALVALLAVAAAFGVEQFIYHSEQIIVVRDPASYMQFGYWIAHHGSLPIPQNRVAFGGIYQGLEFGSPAFYQVGHSVVPQFMAGLPIVLGAGYWIGGVGGALLTAPLLGAFGVLTFGGLVARLVGPRWAPVAALVLALSLPELFTSRSAYSEPLTQILFLGGLCFVIDSLGADGVGTRMIALLGGLALGLTVLVRIDGASDILPAIPYCGMLAIARRRQAMPMIGGLVLGTAFGILDGLLLSRPYLAEIKSSVEPLAFVMLAAIVLTEVAVALLIRRGLPQVRGRWLTVAALVPVAITLAFTIRPYVQTVRNNRNPVAQVALARLQLASHLPIDPMRTYAEISLQWVFWYIGIPAVVLATLGAALLARRCLLGRGLAWTLPLMTFGWVIVTCLYRPEISPDQPWASRRLVPAVLPGFILLAVWAVSWIVGWLRQRGFGLVVGGGVACLCALALLLPTATTSFGLRVSRGGPVGVRLVADGLAVKTTYRGEGRAVDQLCAAIPPHSSVLILTPRVAGALSEVIRGMCGAPTALLVSRDPTALEAVVRGIERAGRQPVLLAGWPKTLSGYAATRREIVILHTIADPSTLVTPPLGISGFGEHIWMAEPQP